MNQLPPLSLYVHLPWCTRKCPYCDFNSHELRGTLDFEAYVDALLSDLAFEQDYYLNRKICSIFIGGGTPSLFPAEAIAKLIAQIRVLTECTDDIEITIEANPGSSEQEKFAGFRSAGVNRISIGVQSFEPGLLEKLGRIHSAEEALSAAQAARHAGFERINLDLMYALPGQTPDMAAEDVATAISLSPEHLSLYQLTIEPNTLFHAHPPEMPEREQAWQVQKTVHNALKQSGYVQYEVSAWTRAAQCRHNLNYWLYGDYIGIGAGAHGKVTLTSGEILRYWKQKQPKRYIASAGTLEAYGGKSYPDEANRRFEFLLNTLRLKDGFSEAVYRQHTGLEISELAPVFGQLSDQGLITHDNGIIRCTDKGYHFVDDILQHFLPDTLNTESR